MTTQQNAKVPSLKLNDGKHIPQLGFGVFQVPPADTADAVERALSAGYRAIDTAAAYENEAGVAEGIGRSGLARDDVFVTTKLPNNAHGRDGARKALQESLGRLGYDHVDLYLIHWPIPSKDKYLETWETLIEHQREGRARSIGVSNFRIEDLERIIDATGVVPAVNQIELHPKLQQSELRRFHDERKILTEAWSPLGQGELLDEPAIVEIAQRRNRTPAQVILRWHIQLGNIVIPKSVTPERIEENFRVFDFELSDEDLAKITELDAGHRFGPDPSTFG
jgi:2,5-diketo-D-gluconate reductase A